MPGEPLQAPRGVYVARHVGLMLAPTLPRLLDAPLVYRPFGPPGRDARALVGWGLKGKSAGTAALAQRLGLPYLALEDGFLRSVGLGDEEPPLSIVFDAVGIYYDARRPSALEALVARPADAARDARGEAIAAAWRAARVSKYNRAPEGRVPVDGPFVLAVDQTWGDMSIALGLATAQSFTQMLEAALDEHPQLPIVLKVHPDVIAGRKKAHFERLSPGAAARVTLLAANLHPPSLFEAAAAVYVVTSQMGFEALMWDRPVRCFGMPFYAGWGLTGDALPAPERRRTTAPPTRGALVHAALADYPRYLDPETHRRCEVERVIDWMGLQRRSRQRAAEALTAIGAADWREPLARAYVARRPQAPGLLEPLAALVPADGLASPTDHGTASVGAAAEGADADRLEALVVAARANAAKLARAAALRTAIVAGARARTPVWQAAQPGRHRVLVAGGDAAAVSAARARDPQAWIVHRPVAPAAGAPATAADEVVTDRAALALVPFVDMVDTDTTAVGLAALLHGKAVVSRTALPIAGWGLTDDLGRAPRAGGPAPLDALVAALLIDDALYTSRSNGAFTTPERRLQELDGSAEDTAPLHLPLRFEALARLKQWRDRLRRGDRLRRRR
jgi:capsular polysaccharide export protein